MHGYVHALVGVGPPHVLSPLTRSNTKLVRGVRLLADSEVFYVDSRINLLRIFPRAARPLWVNDVPSRYDGYVALRRSNLRRNFDEEAGTDFKRLALGVVEEHDALFSRCPH